MKNIAALLALVAVVLGVGGYFYWRSLQAPAPPPPPPVAKAEPPPAPPEPPKILHPVPDPQAGTPPLPGLAESDATLKDAAAGLFGKDTFARYFFADGLVRRFVATVDNLPRKTTALRLMPVRPVPGAFAVTGPDDNRQIAPANALRYRPYVLVMEAVESKRLVATYVHFYPLFQAAYQELGYPKGYFNDRLVQAIDDMLAAPAPASPRLTQPKVLYLYADPDLEDRSAGQKILMRMGPENAARVKDKLRSIRRELTQQPPP